MVIWWDIYHEVMGSTTIKNSHVSDSEHIFYTLSVLAEPSPFQPNQSI